MKTVLMTLMTLSFVLLTFIGCDLFTQEKTLSYDLGGLCVEITTDDKDLQDAADAAGYKEEACPSENQLGYCEDYTSFEGDSFDAYLYSPTYTLESAEQTCGFLGSTWVAN